MAGWPISDRYRLVLSALNALLTSVLSSFSGTSAAGAVAVATAESALSACESLGVPPIDRSGARNGVQPSVGSRNAVSSLLSLPLTSFVAFGSAAALAALNCAVW